MESFELIRTHLATSGIEISQKSLKTHSFNARNSTIFIFVCLNSSLTAATLGKASTFDECVDILFQSVSLGTCGIIYVIIVWKASKLFQFIDNLANTVDERK